MHGVCVSYSRLGKTAVNSRKITSALEPQNIVETGPGREKFSEIKPLVPTHARQSQVTKIAAKQLLLWSHKTHLLYREQNLWILLKTTTKA